MTPQRPQWPAVRVADAVRAAYQIDRESVPLLTAWVTTTRGWLTPATIKQLGPRVCVAWVLLHRRDGNVPAAAAVYTAAAVYRLHPLAASVARGLDQAGLEQGWHQIISGEVTAALTRAGWLSFTGHPENLALGENAGSYFRRQGIVW